MKEDPSLKLKRLLKRIETPNLNTESTYIDPITRLKELSKKTLITTESLETAKNKKNAEPSPF